MAVKPTAKIDAAPAVDAVAASGKPALVTLPADCRMSTQGGLMADLLRTLDERAIVLDGQAVERIDTAALQLLALFRREVATRGGSVRWREPSGALHDAASLLGLTNLLELPVSVPA
ncbi:MAG: STAS domain-containing protein [Rhodanobacter sp.]